MSDLLPCGHEAVRIHPSRSTDGRSFASCPLHATPVWFMKPAAGAWGELPPRDRPAARMRARRLIARPIEEYSEATA